MKDNVFLEQNCKKTSSYLYILLFLIKYNSIVIWIYSVVTVLDFKMSTIEFQGWFHILPEK